jgi:outer membrane protein OmpA-like peptidoglycan-associated protein
MKFLSLALVSVVALAMAGCTPNHPPTKYGNETITNAPLTPAPAPDAGAFGGGTGGPTTTNDLPLRDTANFAVQADPTTGEWPQAAVFTIVYFGFDKFIPESTERAKLDNILAAAKDARVIVAGYTDHYGTEQYNQGLSDKRANSVKNYLVRLGVPEARIEVQAFGKQFARVGGNRDEVAADRRVVVVNADYKP